MENALITILNCSCMMENFNLGIKVLNTQAVVGIYSLDLLSNWIHQNRTLSDVIVFNWLRIFTNNFNIYAYLTQSFCLRYIDSIFVYSFYNNLLKISISIWTKHHNLIKLDRALEDSTSENETNTFSKVS
jgi:hypothetical protein